MGNFAHSPIQKKVKLFLLKNLAHHTSDYYHLNFDAKKYTLYQFHSTIRTLIKEHHN